MTATNFIAPFQLTTQGRVATTTDPDLIALQRVRSLISTAPGERVMLSDYGIDLPAYLFSPNVTESITRISTDIISAMQKFEPVITIIDVRPIINDVADGIEDIDVDFTQATDQSYTPALTASVLVGGMVVEN